MNQANNNKFKITIYRDDVGDEIIPEGHLRIIDRDDVGDEIVPEGHLRIKDIKVLPKMQQRATFKTIQEIESLDREEQLYELTNDYYVDIYQKMLQLSYPPPVTVYLVDKDLILVDGFNRLLASKNAGRKTIPAIVMRGEGTKEEAFIEALKVSCRSNGFHNHLSDKDKRRCFMAYFNTLDCKQRNELLSEDENQKRRLAGKTTEQLSDVKLAGLLYLTETKIVRTCCKLIKNGSQLEQKQITISDPDKKTHPAHTTIKNHWVYLWKNALVPEYIHNTMNKNYDISELAEATCFENEDELERWVRTIERKKQVIIYGPPGTGKTFLAKELAKYLTQTREKGDRWNIVQFHPSYSYEDFIQGIRPEIDDNNSQDEKNKDQQSTIQVNGQIKYKWEKGRFLKFCEPAEDPKNNTKTYVLIIDEINRANLSSVFGELMYLLEYRGETIKLAGNGKEFEIPKNVLIIGTMNTADRSVSPIDNALRRRFAFLHLPPNVEILDRYYKHKKTQFPIDDLKNALDYINKGITNDNFKMGVSFFLLDKKFLDKELDKNSAKVKDIWEMEIIPYLKDNSFILNDELKKLLLDNDLTWDKIKSISSKANQSDVSNTTN